VCVVASLHLGYWMIFIIHICNEILFLVHPGILIASA
jgi:hypothetical protein